MIIIRTGGFTVPNSVAMLTRDEVIQLILYLIVATALLLVFWARGQTVKLAGGGAVPFVQIPLSPTGTNLSAEKAASRSNRQLIDAVEANLKFVSAIV